MYNKLKQWEGKGANNPYPLSSLHLLLPLPHEWERARLERSPDYLIEQNKRGATQKTIFNKHHNIQMFSGGCLQDFCEQEPRYCVGRKPKKEVISARDDSCAKLSHLWKAPSQKTTLHRQPIGFCNSSIWTMQESKIYLANPFALYGNVNFHLSIFS